MPAPNLDLKGTKYLMTAPLEANFPCPLAKKYPLANGVVSKLWIESVYIHLLETEEVLKTSFPTGMRNFILSSIENTDRRFDGAFYFRIADLCQLVFLHLTYTGSTHVIDGYVDYGALPCIHGIDFMEVEYGMSVVYS